MNQYKVENNTKPFSRNNPYRLENIKILVKYINPDVKVIGISDEETYGQIGLVVLIKCSCGKEFKRRINEIDREDCYLVCKECGRKLRARTLSLKKLEEKLSLIENAGFKILSNTDYIEDNDRILLENKDGYRTTIKYANFRINNGDGIKWFSSIHNEDNVIYNANVFCKNNDIPTRILGYSDSQPFKRASIKCLCACGNTFDTTVNGLVFYHKTRCTNCTLKRSKWCQSVEEYFAEKKLTFSKEVFFDDCRDKGKLPFDYQLDINNGLIEVDGEQHYIENRYCMGLSKEEKAEHFKLIQLHDAIKENYCKQNGIKFLRISYKDIQDGSYKEMIDKFIT